MAEFSYFWGGTSVGDAIAAPYSDDEFTDVTEFLMTYDRTLQGVLPTIKTGYIGNLEVSNAGGSTARVAPGAALVDGKLYANSGNVDFVVSGAAVYWVIGLIKDFTAQTVRAFARGNYATAALALASLVQTDGTTWEIALATVLTTAGGAISVIKDRRNYVGRRSEKSLFIAATTSYTLVGAVVYVPYNGPHQLPGVELPPSVKTSAVISFGVPSDYISGGIISFIAAAESINNMYVENASVYLAPLSGALPADIGTITNQALAFPVADTMVTFLPTDVSAGIEAGLELYTDVPVIVVEFERAGTNVLDTIAQSVFFLGITFDYTAGV